ncbi:MAG TPA: hypothetical protein VM261_19685 [Kofleriaceae bacterium]|nr:hypothetical protein [Kofleriaceae bacterium]
MKLLSLLAASTLLLPLAACSDEPDPIVVSATPLACGRQICELERPVAVGAKVAFQTTPLGIATSARVVEGAVATLEAGFLQAEEAYTLTAVAPGRVTVELLDADAQVVGTQVFDVAAADHLEATITLTTAAGTSQLDRVTAEQPQSVPAAATARIAIDQRRGADSLLGWSEYTFEPSLTGGARVVRWDREGNATIELAAGQQAVEFKSTSTALQGRFVLAAR